MKIKLTAPAVERLKPPSNGQVDYFDQSLPGFALRITHNGIKSYSCFYRVAGKLRRETLGRHPILSLAAARQKAVAVFDAAGQGRDPRQERQQQEVEAARAHGDIYVEAVEDFILKHAIAKKNNRRHREQKRLLLRVDKSWHARPVASIGVRDVHDVLDGLMAEGKGYTANRVYEALHAFFRWLYQRDRVPVDIMGKIERPFDGEAPRKRSWSDDELVRLWKSADALAEGDAAYLRLVLLLGQRRSEISGLRWLELDLEAATWTLPAARTKNKTDHVFPLPVRAVELLRSLPRIERNPFVFPGRGLCPVSVGQRQQDRIKDLSGVTDFRFHDARRTFRTGLDKLHIQPHVKDECLNHARRGVGDRHYSQYDYLPEQRAAFEAWSSFLGELLGEPESNVIAIKKRGKR